MDTDFLIFVKIVSNLLSLILVLNIVRKIFFYVGNEKHAVIIDIKSVKRLYHNYLGKLNIYYY